MTKAEGLLLYLTRPNNNTIYTTLKADQVKARPDPPHLAAPGLIIVKVKLGLRPATIQLAATQIVDVHAGAEALAAELESVMGIDKDVGVHLALARVAAVVDRGNLAGPVGLALGAAVAAAESREDRVLHDEVVGVAVAVVEGVDGERAGEAGGGDGGQGGKDDLGKHYEW